MLPPTLKPTKYLQALFDGEEEDPLLSKERLGLLKSLVTGDYYADVHDPLRDALVSHAAMDPLSCELDLVAEYEYYQADICGTPAEYKLGNVAFYMHCVRTLDTMDVVGLDVYGEFDQLARIKSKCCADYLPFPTTPITVRCPSLAGRYFDLGVDLSAAAYNGEAHHEGKDERVSKLEAVFDDGKVFSLSRKEVTSHLKKQLKDEGIKKKDDKEAYWWCYGRKKFVFKTIVGFRKDSGHPWK